jgi:hypothetical protein
MPHMMDQSYAYDPYTQWTSQASFPSSTPSPMSDHLYYEPHATYSQAQVDPRFVASTSPAQPAAQPRSRTTSPQDAQAPRGLPGAADTRARNVECLLGGAACPGFFTLVPHQVKRGIAEHLHEHHRGGGASPDCSWDGCVCAAQSGRLGRCSDRPAEHPAHVSDLADHILHSHLGFRYLSGLPGSLPVRGCAREPCGARRLLPRCDLSCFIAPEPLADFSWSFGFGVGHFLQMCKPNV